MIKYTVLSKISSCLKKIDIQIIFHKSLQRLENIADSIDIYQNDAIKNRKPVHFEKRKKIYLTYLLFACSHKNIKLLYIKIASNIIVVKTNSD